MAERAPQPEGVIARYRRMLAELGVGAEHIYLFGSYKDGTQREGSDIDLVVVSTDFEGLGFWDRARALGVAAMRILEPIEARGFTPREIEEGKLPGFWKHVLENEAVPADGPLPPLEGGGPPAARKPPELGGTIARYREALQGLGVCTERVYLFGRYKDGTQREGSEIDLVVVSREFEGLGLWERLKVFGVAAARILEPIRARGFTPQEVEARRMSSSWVRILDNEAVPV